MPGPVPRTDVDVDRWVRRYRPSATSTRELACFPHAGGSASFYHPVAQALAPGLDVLAIQYPGRQDRRAEAPLTSIPLLADKITNALLEQKNRTGSDRSIALFGHSMGALIAFEVAVRLEASGIVPAALIVSGRRAPSVLGTGAPADQPDANMVMELPSPTGNSGEILDDDEVLNLILPVFRADHAAISDYRYQPGPPLATPIAAFIGENDPRVNRKEASAWSAHTATDFTLYTFPGGHFYLSEHQTIVLAALRTYLERNR
jgi:pyochelin biosynthetic protein PchC